MTGDHVVHEFFRDTAQAAWDTWKSARRWKKALWIFLMLVMSPFIIEGGVLLFLLGIFMPIGFFFGLLEHHLPFLWGAYVCIVNIGGLGDLVADVTMLGDVLSIMFGTKTVGHLEPLERSLALSRVLMTVIGGAGGVLLIYCAMAAEEKKEGEKNTEPASSGIGDQLGMILLILLWKVVMVGIRCFIIFRVLYAICRHRKIDHTLQVKIQFLECVVLLDVLWSAIPLGVLTLLEMTVFNEGSFHADFFHVFEVFKLCCLAIDIAGITHLFYWVILDLQRWCRPTEYLEIAHGEEHTETA
eukprot:TRINITY_DN9537_c0_g1_i1.p1 TRINITY_DN9537_c0_g1~~TRINITY_DN9537_c0_g1_i1.p1  ORF type:complete len:299 (+),score=50.84 TRINITY_DN9537_c0_g1_i1:92-988(+)